MKEIKYKAIMVREETHERFVKSVEYGQTHDNKINELLDICNQKKQSKKK